MTEADRVMLYFHLKSRPVSVLAGGSLAACWTCDPLGAAPCFGNTLFLRTRPGLRCDSIITSSQSVWGVGGYAVIQSESTEREAGSGQQSLRVSTGTNCPLLPKKRCHVGWNLSKYYKRWLSPVTRVCRVVLSGGSSKSCRTFLRDSLLHLTSPTSVWI